MHRRPFSVLDPPTSGQHLLHQPCHFHDLVFAIEYMRRDTNRIIVGMRPFDMLFGHIGIGPLRRFEDHIVLDPETLDDLTATASCGVERKGHHPRRQLGVTPNS